MLLALKILGRWLTIETGKVGEDDEPEIMVSKEEDQAEEEEPKSVVNKALGFSIIDPWARAYPDRYRLLGGTVNTQVHDPGGSRRGGDE